jgi:hypothetical protein
MEGAEEIGAVVTGALAARAVEPGAGEAGAEGGVPCLNCGTPVLRRYCPECGQRARVHRTLGAIWHDIAHSVLHFEGKIWRTLPLLAWRPGELTRRYVEGERARFVSPMALFLFSVFLMFAVISALGTPIFDPEAKAAIEGRDEARLEFEQEQAEDRAKLDRLRAERARLAAAGESTVEADIDIKNVERALALKERLYRQALASAALEEKEKKAAREAEAKPSPGPAQTAAQKAEEDEKVVLVGGADSLNAWFNSAYQKAKKNPSLLLYKIQSNAYKFSWALIPISVPFVWLLFLHRRRYRQHYSVYDHTVFVTYSIAFMSLGVVALMVLKPLGLNEAVVGLATAFVPPIHMYRQLRGAYQLSRWSAAWRTLALLIFAGLAGSIFFILLLALGVLG